jgi:lysophospholipase L1-like esterase
MSKIIFAGDSITQGAWTVDAQGNQLTGLTNAQKFSTLVGNARGFDTVVNAGVSGDTVTGLYNRLYSIISQSPDVVVIMIGTNDVGHAQTPITTLATFTQKINDIVEALLAENIRVCLMSWPTANHDYWGGVNSPAYLDAIAQAAQSHSVGYIPVYEMWCAYKWAAALTVEAYDALYWEQSGVAFHPSVSGAQVIADFILKNQFSHLLTVEPPSVPITDVSEFVEVVITAIPWLSAEYLTGLF